MDVSGLKEVVGYAVGQEREAAELYAKYAGIVKSPGTKKLLEDMSAMEREHEKRLSEFANRGIAELPRAGTVADLQISDYLVDIEITESSSVQDVFIFAMKAEQKAFEFYTKLSSLELDSQAHALFGSLAAEEEKHKLDLEIEYETNIMGEN